MNKQTAKIKREQRRKDRTRVKFSGTSKRPRLSVFRSLKNINLQLIDDSASKTLVSVDQRELKLEKKNKTEIAFEVGKKMAEKALEKKITECVFDRSGYKYHGRVKAVAEGAREGGLKF
ncbi:MAG: 50S ribosomal protein L18 [Patescibacteria group bacterium]